MSGSFLEIPKVLQRPLSPMPSLRKPRQSIGASPITGMMQDRYKQLLKEFEQIDKNGDKQLSFAEVHDFLSAKQKSQFDYNLCKEIFSRMDKNHDNAVSISEFLWSYIEAEDILQARIKDIKKTLHDNYKKMDEYQKKLVAARATETLNRYGVMKNSVLTVNLVEAKDLIPMDSNGLSDPYVILSCESQKFTSNCIPETLNPVWNEEFFFNIESGNETLKLTVMDKDVLMPDDFEGEVTIPMSLLKDQMKLDQFFILSQGKEGLKQGRIHLSMQWIWSKTQYLETILKQWKDVMEIDQKDLNSLEEQLLMLKKPFGHLEIQNDWIVREERSTSTRVIGSENGFMMNFDGFAEKKVFQHFDNGVNKNIAGICYVFISVIVMFTRPDFFNVRFT